MGRTWKRRQLGLPLGAHTLRFWALDLTIPGRYPSPQMKHSRKRSLQADVCHQKMSLFAVLPRRLGEASVPFSMLCIQLREVLRRQRPCSHQYTRVPHILCLGRDLYMVHMWECWSYPGGLTQLPILKSCTLSKTTRPGLSSTAGKAHTGLVL